MADAGNQQQVPPVPGDQADPQAARITQLENIIAQLQASMTALQNVQQPPPIQVAAAGAAAAPAQPVQVQYAATPGVHQVEEIIDYSKKQGTTLFDQATRALTNLFDMKPNSTVVFIQAFKARCREMGWSEGTKNITKFTNLAGNTIDLIEQYGQIDAAALKVQCDRFCDGGGADYATRATQNNTMMSICLNNTLTADAKARLLPYRSDFTFNGNEYAPLMFKIIMRLATIDSVATTEALRANLRELPTYTATVKGDLEKVHSHFDENYSQLLARGATIDDAVGILFDAYRVVPCANFQNYIVRKHEMYLDGELTGVTHESLMAMATDKYTYLRNKGLWGAKSKDDQIIAMAAELKDLKGRLKLAPNVKKIADGDDKDKKKKDKEKKGKNKKGKSDKKDQKADEAWKKVPPKDGEPKQKTVSERTYHWCVHHMAWTMHAPADCRLGKERKDDQTGQPAPAKSTSLNPAYSALLANIARAAADE